MTERENKPESAEPTPELPEEAADLEPQSQPLAHDEPPAAHTVAPLGSTERAIDHADTHTVGEGLPDAHTDDHATETHEHAEEHLGPIDWPAWGVALAGLLVGAVIIAAFFVAAYLNRPA